MPKDPRLTNSSEETQLNKLFSGDLVFSVPCFQRRYKWKLDKLQTLQQNLLDIIDTEGSHFLGAIIIYARPNAAASDPAVYDVIDGQQRITTALLYLCAIIRSLCKAKLYDDAVGAFLKYLVVNREIKLPSNSRLQSAKDDRAQLNRVFDDLLRDKAFAEKLGAFKYKPLPAVGDGKGRLWSNYHAATRFLDAQTRLEGVERLHALYSALIESVTIVEIVVRDPIDGPKIYDSLNSKQEPMTTGDLVRNEIFSRVAERPPAEIEAIDNNKWQPFYTRFGAGDKSLFDEYFFPYGLIQNPNMKKSEVFEGLRRGWRNIQDPEQIIMALADYQNAFLDVAQGTNTQNPAQLVCDAFLRLYRANAPTSTYPFLMQLSNAIRDGGISHEDAIKVLGVIESFLVRRAICGHEPTGLHAVFKRLWADCKSTPDESSVESAIRKHRTVAWPGTDDVRTAIEQRALYGSSITPYLLVEWNRHVGGDQPSAHPWIEHVLPDRPAKGWFKDFTAKQHAEMKDLLANLLPLSKEMNQSLSNRVYDQKKDVYETDSGFKGTRQFAKEYPMWTPAEVDARSHVLAGWAVTRWPT